MDIQDRHKGEKLAYHISLGSLIFLLLGSIIFYQERMLFVDPAFIAFEIINSGDFVFSEQRIGAFISQVFPLIGVKLGLSVKSILILYSASFYIFFVAVAYIAGYILKQYKIAILFCLYFWLMVTDVYFWPNNEIHQAVGWMVLFLSIYNWSENNKWEKPIWVHLLLIATLFFATISHLLIILPLGFLWIYQIITSIKAKVKFTKRRIFYSLTILAFVGFRYWLSHSSWYDGAKLNGVKNVSFDGLLNAFSNDQAASIVSLLFSHYWVMLVMFVVGLFLLIKRKKHLILGLTVLSSIAYFTLVVLTHSAEISDNNLFYFESQWTCLSIILSAPFIFEIFKSIKENRAILILFLLIFIIKTPYLLTSLDKFQTRLTYLTIMVQEANNQNISKAYINSGTYKNDDLEEALFMTWGVPVESLLLSSINHNSQALTIKIFDKKKRISSAKDSIYTAFKFVDIDDINSKYFELDTLSQYRPLLDEI